MPFRFRVFLLVVLVLSACSTQKKKGEPSGFKKFYHNTTALYNGYFNANVLYEESLTALNAQHQDNYNQILPMYKYTAASNPQAQYSTLDKVIQKVSVDVHLHRISHWTDDCYLLLGKAHYLKQDFESAQETFEFFVQEFDMNGNSKSKPSGKEKKSSRSRTASASRPGGSGPTISREEARNAKEKKKEREKQIKERKKSNKKTSAKDAKATREARKQERERDSLARLAAQNPGNLPETSPAAAEKPTPAAETSKESKTSENTITPGGEAYDPDSYFLKHKPCYQEGVLWLARTYIERSNYDNARMYLKQLENDTRTFKEIRAEAAAAEAYSYLKQKNYNSAVLPLTKAVELSDNRAERARFSFILAQLLERSGNHTEAAAAFDRVIRMRPDYVMDFYARLGRIQNEHLSGNGNPEALVSRLDDMLKERKYTEFYDQLYFARAKVRLNSNEQDKAIEDLEKALAQPSASKTNRVEIFYTLATLYHQKEKYVPAKAYYDSTLTVMEKTDDRYALSTRMSGSLTEVAQQLGIIQHQDSLLRITAMSDEEKMALAQKLKKEKEAAMLAAPQVAAKPAPGPMANTFIAPQAGRTLFFAYDQRNLTKNRKEFDRIWPNRPLEDNWRRSNRQSAILAGNTGGDSTQAVQADVISELELKDLLKGVPSSPGEIAAAEEKIANAMIALGRAFRDKMNRADKSAAILDEMEKRFPANIHEADMFYLQYLNYRELNNPARSNHYKDLILSKHSGSLYAEVLRDPDYFKRKREEQNKLNTYYASTYNTFSEGNIEKAMSMSSQATQLFGPDNQLKAKFALLNAMCVGKIKGPDEYMHALREVVAKYPNTEEQTRAREILRLLGQRVQGSEADSTSASKTPASELYKPEDEDLHYVLVVVRSPKLSLNDTKIKVSDYNNKFHQHDQLKISNIVLGEKNDLPVVVVRRFNNRETAFRYFDGIQKNRDAFITDPTLYEVLMISQGNYRNLVSSRSIEPYREFFLQHYMN